MRKSLQPCLREVYSEFCQPLPLHWYSWSRAPRSAAEAVRALLQLPSRLCPLSDSIIKGLGCVNNNKMLIMQWHISLTYFMCNLCVSPYFWGKVGPCSFNLSPSFLPKNLWKYEHILKHYTISLKKKEKKLTNKYLAGPSHSCTSH